jgi:hypothetical protein
VLIGVLRLYKDNLLGHLRTAKVGRSGYYFALTRSEPSVYVLHPDTRLLKPRAATPTRPPRVRWKRASRAR